MKYVRWTLISSIALAWACGTAPSEEDAGDHATDAAAWEDAGLVVPSPSDAGPPPDAGPPRAMAPVLTTAARDGASYVLTFEMPPGSLAPEGGFDTYVDGVDRNDNADHPGFTRVITGLGGGARCFEIEARYTQLEPPVFLLSNERCVEPDRDRAWVERRAFPSLYGEGADTIEGGRGGIKFFVTTLSSEVIQTYVPAREGVEEHYEGSLSGALTLDRPRHVIPRVSGNVVGSVHVSDHARDRLTFHGHLAPEGGIAVIDGNVSFTRVDDVALRYLTIRHGRDAGFATDDGLALSRVSRWAIDHCSIGWAGDEASSVALGTSSEPVVYGPIVYQRTLFGQGVTGHDRGMILGSSPAGSAAEITANVHLNFWVVAARTPNVAGNEGTFVRSANSVVYDWNGRTTNLLRRPHFDEIGNHYRPGPLTVSPIAGHLVNKYQDQRLGPPSIYTAGNVVDGLLTDPSAENQSIWSYFDPDDGRGMDDDPLPAEWFRSEPLPTQPGVGYVPVSAAAALASVIDDREVGNNRATGADGETVRYHDAVDTRYFTAFEARADPRTPQPAWEHPPRPSGTPYPDANWNGIDDAFELAHGITSADQVIREWTLDGVVLSNEAGYDAFEVWSAVRAGDLELAR